MFSKLLALILALTPLNIVPTPAYAEPTPIYGNFFTGSFTQASGPVYVDSKVWPANVREAVKFIDKYTGTTLHIAPCKEPFKCIRIRYGNPGRGNRGYTLCQSGTCTITLSLSLHRVYRTRVIEHELGHAHGLPHNPRCTSIMWPYRICYNGKQPPEYVTTIERRKLRNA